MAKAKKQVKEPATPKPKKEKVKKPVSDGTGTIHGKDGCIPCAPDESNG